MPAPVTRTLNTSPSTSTSNSAVVVGGAGGGEGGGSGLAGGGGGGLGVVTAGTGFGAAEAASFLRIRGRLVRKQQLDQDRVVGDLDAHLPELQAGALDLRLEQVGGPDRDRLLAAEDQAAQLRIGGHRGPAIQALEVVLQLLGDGRVALAADHVVDRLCSDHLADRRHQRRIAELEADTVRVLEDLANPAAGLV